MNPFSERPKRPNKKHEQMPNPTFHIIGAPKCGTDTIASWLNSHRSIHLIDARGDQGREDPQFAPDGAEIVGMISPWALSSEEAILEVVQASPDARFIVCLRNPIDMAWALHSDALAAAREPIADFSAAWDAGAARRDCRDCSPASHDGPIDYAGTCALGSQLIRLTAFVDPHQVHLVFLDDILTAPQSVWSDLQAFLEIDEEGRSDFPLEERLVPYRRRGIEAHMGALMKSAPARALMQKVSSLGAKRAINGFDRRRKALREMPADLRRKVCDQLSDDIGLISALSGRDLAHWLC